MKLPLLISLFLLPPSAFGGGHGGHAGHSGSTGGHSGAGHHPLAHFGGGHRVLPHFGGYFGFTPFFRGDPVYAPAAGVYSYPYDPCSDAYGQPVACGGAAAPPDLPPPPPPPAAAREGWSRPLLPAAEPPEVVPR